MLQFAVVQTQLERVDVSTLSQVLQEAAGLVRADANTLAKRSQGILGERFTPQQAQAIVQTLTSMGYSFKLMPTSSLIELEKPRRIAWVSFSDEGVTIPFGYHDKSILIPWASIFVISAGHVAVVETIRTEVQTSRGGASRLMSSDVPTTEIETTRNSKKTHITDIIGIASDGRFINARISADSLAYDRIQPPLANGTSTQRYFELVQRCVAKANHAVIGPATHNIMNQRHQGSFAGDGLAHVESKGFNEHNRWLLQMAVLQEMERQK